MNIEHISVSRSGVWTTCPQQYKFKYHLKVPPPGKQPEYFLYGKLIHKIIEEYTKTGGAGDLKKIRRECLNGDILLEDSLPEDTPPPKSQLSKSYLNKITKHLESFLKFANKCGYEGLCEWKFKHDLDPPNQKYAFGFIDHLKEKDGTYLIVDYKTTKKGRWRKTKKDAHTDLQLQCYSMAVSRKFGAPASKIYASLMYLEGCELVGATFTDETLDQVEANLLKTYNAIEQSDPDTVKGWVGNHCDRCDYADMCPFYSLI